MPRPRRSSVGADINVTPLVDVVLVLLIIFMVVMPQAESGIPLDLPKLLSPKTQEADLEAATVSITKDGVLFLDQDRMTGDELASALKTIRAADPKRKVVIRGDKAARYAEVRRVFKQAQDLGFPGVMLQVVPQGPSEGEG